MSRIFWVRLFGTLTALLFVAMAVHSAPLDPAIPTIHFSFSEASFSSILVQWQPDGVTRFKAHFAFDFPLLISYGCFGYLLARHTSLTIGLPDFLRWYLYWALPAAAVMDFVENVLHLHFVYAASAIPATFFFVAGVLATFKWLLIAAFVIVASYARVRRTG